MLSVSVVSSTCRRTASLRLDLLVVRPVFLVSVKASSVLYQYKKYVENMLVLLVLSPISFAFRLALRMVSVVHPRRLSVLLISMPLEGHVGSALGIP